MEYNVAICNEYGPSCKGRLKRKVIWISLLGHIMMLSMPVKAPSLYDPIEINTQFSALRPSPHINANIYAACKETLTFKSIQTILT